MALVFPEVPVHPVGVSTLNETIDAYIDKIERLGNTYPVGVSFFKNFVRNIKDGYIHVIPPEKILEGTILMKAFNAKIDNLYSFNELKTVMKNFATKLLSLVPAFQRNAYETKLVSILNYLANNQSRRIFTSGRKRTRKARKQKHRKTRGKRLHRSVY